MGLAAKVLKLIIRNDAMKEEYVVTCTFYVTYANIGAFSPVEIYGWRVFALVWAGEFSISRPRCLHRD